MLSTESFLHRCPDGTPLGREARLKDADILKYPVRLAQLIGREVHEDGLLLFREAGKLLYGGRSLSNDPVTPDGRRWCWTPVPPSKLYSRFLHTDQPDHLAMSAIYAPQDFPGRSTLFTQVDPCLQVTKTLIPSFRGSLSTKAAYELEPILDEVLAAKRYASSYGVLALSCLSVWQRLRKALHTLSDEDLRAAENFADQQIRELKLRGLLYEHFWKKNDLVVLSSGILHARGAGSSRVDGDEALRVDDLD